MTARADAALEELTKALSAAVEAERHARADAETARLRERQLRLLATKLSSALTRQQIAEIACAEAVAALSANSAMASLVVDDDIEIIGFAGPANREVAVRYTTMPLASALPSAEAVLGGRLVWCSGQAALAERYAHLEEVWRPRGIHAWGAVPLTFEGRAIGSLGISFLEPHELAATESELLHGVGQLAAQALERARLFEAHQESEARLRTALIAARAATWSIDLRTMEPQRDATYGLLVGDGQLDVPADFMSIHPDDRAIAQAAFAKTIETGAPYDPIVRIRRDDGTYMWIQAHGRITQDARRLAGVIVDIDAAKQLSLRVEEERRINDTMHRLASSFASELDHDRLVQLITEETAKMIGAELAAFVSDAEDTPPAASQLRIPVVGHSGEVYGRLVFGHREPGRFTEHHERLATSIASQSAIALENARLYTTVRDQKKQLELAFERARAADGRKDEFLAMLGHELRNPLAPIVTALDLMDLREAEVAGVRMERDVIRRQVSHLSTLISDLLDVSRITRGKIQLAKQIVEISTVVASAIETVSPLLEGRMQSLAIDVPEQGLRIAGDPTRLAQVFQNLLTNASKYSDPRSRIELRATAVDNAIVIEVRDHGKGIPAHLLPSVFTMFIQGERTIDRAAGGLGLGLAIAKSLCEMHRGTIAATSAGEGHGSTFTVTLPRSTAAVAAPVDVERRVVPVGPASRVLVVDDNVEAATTLREYLRALGHELAVAHDGPTALELATTFHPEVAVLDIGLPVMNGYELARLLRERQGPEPLRLIAVTGYGQDADRKRALEGGFDHHLVKPIELGMLLELLVK